MNHVLRTLSTAAALALAVAACGGDDDESADEPSGGESGSSGEVATLTVGASPTPHAGILEFVDENLAADAGIDLEVVPYDDYVLPNQALSEGDLDANYFQHLPYFESEVADRGYDFAHFDGVHIEPYGLYADGVDAVEDIPDGGQVGITNDPSNQARALDLLVENDLITLEDTGDEAATLLDVAENPRDLEFVETAPEQLVRSLEDLDAAVINGNFALEAGLNPATDALALEDGDGNPYANFLAVRAEDEESEAVVELDALLHSEEVRGFIAERWPEGEVLPAF